jgi:hypothetical protein
MTLEELEKIFWGDVREQPTRVRLKRVVEALRDELFPGSEPHLSIWVDERWGLTLLNEILASDGVEAKPVCPTCKGAGALFGPYDPSDRTPCPECTPAAAPVCQWRANEYEGAYSPGCETPAVWYSDGSETPQKEGYNFCPSCGKPIKFKEAAR